MLVLGLEKFATQYQNGDPFPHTSVENAFDSRIVEIAENFPEPSKEWWAYNNPLEKKLACNNLKILPICIVNFINYLNSNPFISEIEKLTGIQGLIADHTLNGAGLHQIMPGGKLDIHADYNYHPITKLDRRVNVLIYLNHHWNYLKWGGCLELWNESMTRCEMAYAPFFNRMVVFSTSDIAYHGHPQTLQCPKGITRKSIAMYYYTNGRPEYEKSAPHSTIFKRRPQDPILEELEDLRRKRAISRL